MGPKANNNHLETMEKDLNLVQDRVEHMETNSTHLLQQLMQKMKQLETRFNLSNKSEAIG